MKLLQFSVFFSYLIALILIVVGLSTTPWADAGGSCKTKFGLWRLCIDCASENLNDCGLIGSDCNTKIGNLHLEFKDEPCEKIKVTRAMTILAAFTAFLAFGISCYNIKKKVKDISKKTYYHTLVFSLLTCMFSLVAAVVF